MALLPASERLKEPGSAPPDSFPRPFVSVATIVSQLEQRAQSTNTTRNPSGVESRNENMASNGLRRPTLPRSVSPVSSLHGMEIYVPQQLSNVATAPANLQKDLPPRPEIESQAKRSGELNRSAAHVRSSSRDSSPLWQSMGFNEGSRSRNHVVDPLTTLPNRTIPSPLQIPPMLHLVLPEPSPSVTPTSTSSGMSTIDSSRSPTRPFHLQAWLAPPTPPTPLSPAIQYSHDRHISGEGRAHDSIDDGIFMSFPAPPSESLPKLPLAELRGTKGIDSPSNHLTIATLEAAGVRAPKGGRSKRCSSIYTVVESNSTIFDDDEWEDEEEQTVATSVLNPETHKELVDEYRQLARPNTEYWKDPAPAPVPVPVPDADVARDIRLVPLPLFWGQPSANDQSPKTQSPSSKPQDGTPQSLHTRYQQSRAAPSKRTSVVLPRRTQSKFGSQRNRKSIKGRFPPPVEEFQRGNITVTTSSPDFSSAEIIPAISPPASSSSTSFPLGIINLYARRKSKKTASAGKVTSPTLANAPGPKSPNSTNLTDSPSDPTSRSKRSRTIPSRINTRILSSAINTVLSPFSPNARSASMNSKSTKQSKESKESRSSSGKSENVGRVSDDLRPLNSGKRAKFPNLFGLVSERRENREWEKRKADVKSKITYVSTVNPDEVHYPVKQPDGWI